MTFEQMSTSPADYVVLDVETNGLSSKKHDLLSISIYKPDDGAEYDRFLPLDLNEDVYTTHINGITRRDLKGKQHLDQAEVDSLIRDFELDRRTILHYGSLDERFIRDYFARQGLFGFERMHFFDFKRLICSTSFSDGSLTKDNLCNFFGIEGVSGVHSGMNDCKLEWELFKKLDGRYMLARIVPNEEQRGMWKLSILSPEYIIPISYLSTYPKLSCIAERPYICCESEEVFRQDIKGRQIERFPSNTSGMLVEHLINRMLDAQKQDNAEFLTRNSANNKFVGYMPSGISFMPLTFNDDGTVAAVRHKDWIQTLKYNATLRSLKRQIKPLVKFIREDIFKGAPVTSQELVVNDSLGILALCDLSTDEAVLEIKTSACDPKKYAEQLYYESRGRAVYLLGMEWGSERTAITIRKVTVKPGQKPNPRRERALASMKPLLEKEQVEVVDYTVSSAPVLVRCKACGHEWSESYNRIRAGRCVCPECHPERAVRRGRKPRPGSAQRKREKPTPGQELESRARRYAEKVLDRGGGGLIADISSYTGSKEPVSVRCSSCGCEWTVRADHLLARCRCRRCG